jgi:hypothetical protein
VFRSSRNIALTLLSSAALFGCCLTSCHRCEEVPERDAQGHEVRDANGNVIYRRHCYWRTWGRSGYGWGYYHSSPYSSYSSSSGVRTGGGVGASMAGATSRGGFGGTGRASVGG